MSIENGLGLNPTEKNKYRFSDYVLRLQIGAAIKYITVKLCYKKVTISASKTSQQFHSQYNLID